jgi:hypothetical protein
MVESLYDPEPESKKNKQNYNREHKDTRFPVLCGVRVLGPSEHVLVIRGVKARSARSQSYRGEVLTVEHIYSNGVLRL